MPAITPANGRVAFLAAQTPHTYFELNSTNTGTNYGDDPVVLSDITGLGAGDFTTQESYEGMQNNTALPANTSYDDFLINDAAMLIYIPAGLTHGNVYGLFNNGGGTNGQGAMLRATTTGVEIACGHNNGNSSSQDNVIEEIPDADLPGWFCVSFQFNSHGGAEGDMALWLNGTAVRSGTRVYTLDWGSGNAQVGDANHAEPDGAACLDPASYGGGDWGADLVIDGTGILIANHTVDNPSSGASDTAAGNGDTWHTDYYDTHVVSPNTNVTTSAPDALVLTEQAATVQQAPRVYLNTTETKSGATEMTVTDYNTAGTSITFTDPSGAPTGSLKLGVENTRDQTIGWIDVTVTAGTVFPYHAIKQKRRVWNTLLTR